MQESVQAKTISCTDAVKVSQIVMIALVMVGSVIGNSMICVLLIRFKTLRTVTNVLIANLAVVDILILILISKWTCNILVHCDLVRAAHVPHSVQSYCDDNGPLWSHRPQHLVLLMEVS